MIKLTTSEASNGDEIVVYIDPAAITAVSPGDDFRRTCVVAGGRMWAVAESGEEVLKLIDDALEEAFGEEIIGETIEEVDANVEDRLDWCEEAVANLDARITEALTKLMKSTP